MALGVWAAEVKKKSLLVIFLILTTVFGVAFLGIKYVEYKEKWEKHHIPGAHFDVSEFVNPKAYGLNGKAAGAGHGAEDAGVLLPVLCDDRNARAAHDHRHRASCSGFCSGRPEGDFSSGYVAPIENFGLYWHFVDIVWLFLFPLLYLINRHPFRQLTRPLIC